MGPNAARRRRRAASWSGSSCPTWHIMPAAGRHGWTDPAWRWAWADQVNCPSARCRARGEPTRRQRHSTRRRPRRRAGGAEGVIAARRVPLCVIPEGAGSVNPNGEDRLVVVCGSLPTGGQPSARRRGQRWSPPQRSEDERPWDPLRAESGWQRRRDGCLGSMASFRRGPGGWQLHRQQPLAVGSPSSGAGHPFAAPGRHGAVRRRQSWALRSTRP
jgi:hypothetical protein